MISTTTTKSDKLFISKKWIDEYEPPEDTDKIPPLLKLEEDEKFFKDSEGESHTIEVRGERDYNKCFFLTANVATLFSIKDLIRHVRTTGDYVEGEHYALFKKRSNSVQKTMYLTYVGLIVVATRSRHEEARRFVDWVCQVVFTIHLGAQEAKKKLMAKTLGLDADMIPLFFSVCSIKISGIYILRLCKVVDGREVFSIPDDYADDMTVNKYGLSDDIERRFHEHERFFAELGITGIELVQFTPIDVLCLEDAETDIENYFEDMGAHLDNPEYTEIAIYDTSSKRFKEIMGKLEDTYVKTNTKLQNEVKTMRHTIQLLEERNASMKKEHIAELKAKDAELKAEIKSHASEIKARDITITSLQKTIKTKKKLYKANLAMKDMLIENLQAKVNPVPIKTKTPVKRTQTKSK